MFNREVIGYSAGPNKTAELVQQAFHKITRPLNKITLFHTDRGNEFKNKIIDEILITFKIKRSLSSKGCPYDNAVAEATYKTFKTEFINGKKFANLTQLKCELFDFVNWYNNIRIHGSLNYLTPVEFRKIPVYIKSVLKRVANPKFEYVCLLDKEIGLLSKQRIYFDVQFKVLSLLGDGKRYRDVLDALNHCYISKASISRILNKYDIAEYFQLAEKETKTRIDLKNKNLYIQLDETFLATLDQKVKQDQRIRLVTFHTGHKEKNYKNARRALENKRGHFLMLKVGKRINTMDYRDLLIKELQKHYVNINYDRIIVCGDGATWIREIANSFGNVRYILDGYHAIKKLKQMAFNIVFENRKLTLNSWIELYKNGNHQELIKNIRNVAKNELNKDIKTNLRRNSNYFKNNKHGIHNQNLEWNIGCSIESDVSHLVKQQLGYGAKIYNHKNLNNLLHLRMANLNKLNVLHFINENINLEIEIRKEIYKNSLWNKYNNKNDDSWINKGSIVYTNKYRKHKFR